MIRRFKYPLHIELLPFSEHVSDIKVVEKNLQLTLSILSPFYKQPEVASPRFRSLGRNATKNGKPHNSVGRKGQCPPYGSSHTTPLLVEKHVTPHCHIVNVRTVPLQEISGPEKISDA